MKFINISQDKKNIYTLKKNEQCVFYMFNRTGTIPFELAGTGAEAHIFAVCIGKDATNATLNIIQKHTAPKKHSHTIVKSVLYDTAVFTYNGLIRIEKRAVLSDTSQESRTLLLSPTARASATPTLEILADDVKCRHAATISPISAEQLFFATTRGLNISQATDLLVQGFFNEALERMEKLGVETNVLKNKIDSALHLANNVKAQMTNSKSSPKSE